MEARELVEKVKNNPRTEENYQEIIKWCSENKNQIDLQDKDQSYLYEESARYLMMNKIGKWDKDDAQILINYFVKKITKELNINEKVTINVLGEDEFKEIHGEFGDAVCVNNGDETSNISYSPKILELLSSNDPNKILEGFKIMYHEVIHANQNYLIKQDDSPKTKTVYLMALETIARKYEPKFYKENYNKLLKENNAEKNGLILAMGTFKIYNKKLYDFFDQELIQKKLKEFDKNYYDSVVTLNGKDYDFMQYIDALSAKYIEQHPEIVKDYPILQLGYNLDGSKKDIITLISERNELLSNGENSENIDELYKSIANRRVVTSNGLKGTKEELISLDEYIKETGTDDKFIYELIKYRLEEKYKMTQEQIEQYMEIEYKSAEKTREEKAKQEREKDEKIKDEVGDEFQPKTEKEIQEEQQVETMWKSRFQSWDRDAINLPNSAKKKNEAVKVIKEIERDKSQKEKTQEQGEQEDISK